MSALDDANKALSEINDATNQLGTLAQTISDEIDAFVLAAATPGSQITPEFLASLQAKADAVAALAPVLQGIASKGAANPVPVPVPTP